MPSGPGADLPIDRKADSTSITVIGLTKDQATGHLDATGRSSVTLSLEKMFFQYTSKSLGKGGTPLYAVLHPPERTLCAPLLIW
ncbi:hypothetical protein Smp_178620 [Schistosoma mansoni]|uniref:hypothetical protein n=1 Tax=Schistosoma mansoni TaxID=6183 RepID=UPI00022C8607|nr:hypothetical protein Smp_178620 [Schistosoma mansoni]|eukprot:XP_018644039.1 hypothetical protein Smp_178620 [Schistosoma mansoni]